MLCTHTPPVFSLFPSGWGWGGFLGQYRQLFGGLWGEKHTFFCRKDSNQWSWSPTAGTRSSCWQNPKQQKDHGLSSSFSCWRADKWILLNLHVGKWWGDTLWAPEAMADLWAIAFLLCLKLKYATVWFYKKKWVRASVSRYVGIKEA